MNTIWKNSLQEYCQKQKISLPTYRIKNQSGPNHKLKFQAEVEVNGQWYVGYDLCSSKKDAEQSAAKKAYKVLVTKRIKSSSLKTSSELPSSSSSEIVNDNLKYHLPDEHADIERFIDNKVGAEGGRIRKIFPPDSRGQYKIEITGFYRYCENIKRHHKKNQIYFIVDPIKRTYIQKCHDIYCYGFQSTIKHINIEQNTNSNLEENDTINECTKCYQNLTSQTLNRCERCDEIFCNRCLRECEYCHDAIHCERCFELCFDCHDS